MFSDIERHEAIAIAELLTAAGRAEMIADALRDGLRLSEVRARMAAAAPAPAAPAAAKPARQRDLVGELDAAAQARFAAQRLGR